jgi:hypothetical protein
MSTEIRPFKIEIPDAEIEDLRRRLASTRWPEKELVDDWSQGIPLSYVQEVCAYWGEKYDWRSREALLNQWPQFMTEIDGIDIHFIHVRSKHENAMPLVITHGWPGSVVEFQKVMGPLTEATRVMHFTWFAPRSRVTAFPASRPRRARVSARSARCGDNSWRVSATTSTPPRVGIGAQW